MSLAPSDIGLGVMTHHSRAEMYEKLRSTVYPIISAVDYDDDGENATGDVVWRELGKRDTVWSIVLQDDAQPVDNFRHHAALALSEAPTDLVSFYVGTMRPYRGLVEHAVARAREQDAHWLLDGTLHWGVGVAMKTRDIPGFLAWAVHHPHVPYDQRIGMYFRKAKVPTSYVWPSLVDHADTESLVQRKRVRQPRVAHEVGGREAYDGRVIRIGAVAT